jgi:uncharacterized protein
MAAHAGVTVRRYPHLESDTIEWADNRLDYRKTRVRAIGEGNSMVLHVVFTDRGEVRGIGSARLASRKERRQWRASQ